MQSVSTVFTPCQYQLDKPSAPGRPRRFALPRKGRALLSADQRPLHATNERDPRVSRSTVACGLRVRLRRTLRLRGASTHLPRCGPPWWRRFVWLGLDGRPASLRCVARRALAGVTHRLVEAKNLPAVGAARFDSARALPGRSGRQAGESRPQAVATGGAPPPDRIVTSWAAGHRSGTRSRDARPAPERRALRVVSGPQCVGSPRVRVYRDAAVPDANAPATPVACSRRSAAVRRTGRLA